MIRLVYLAFGAIFGFLISRGGATTFDFHAKLFLFKDFQLLWVMIGAILAGIIVIQVLKRLSIKSVFGSEALNFASKPMKRFLVPGALMLGVGWGMTGSCPGTAPTMLGEGKLATIFTLLGILAGTFVVGYISNKNKK